MEMGMPGGNVYFRTKMTKIPSVSILIYNHGNVSRRLYSAAVKKQVELFADPSTQLQQFLRVPLFKEHEKPFVADDNMIIKAKILFKPSKRHEIKFLRSVVDNPDHYPRGNVPEVLFIGQSNVGKSSLIKAIFENTPDLLVKTSRKPGHTKTLNFFQVGKKLLLVDAPGYGIKQPETFIPAVETYIKNRKNLQRTFLLTDANAGLCQWDMIAIEMLEEFRKPYALIQTKIDLASQSVRLKNLLQLQEIRDKFSSPCCFPQPFLVSNITLEGIGYLQAFIAYISHNIEL